MQAVKQCQTPTKPRGGDIMSQHRDMLANQRIEEKSKVKSQMSDYPEHLNNNNNNSSAI